uniref:La protein 1 n=1 Tax=Fagus sylvatica TaxID=28930 RepID=A0A2N9J4A7_FAGSY
MATPSLDEETVKKVLRQVEFYFSDSNLPRDNFLKKSISESEDGMVDLALICSFSRMRSHLNLGNMKPDEVPEDTVKAVAETLKTSTFLKVSEDGKKVGRTTELLKPEDVIEQLDIKTIAASPFEYDVTREDLETFFAQYAKVNSVRLPRHVGDKRFFCGTALIEFSAEEDAEKVLKQSLVYAGVTLELKPKRDFDIERARETEEYEKSHPLGVSNRKNNSNAEANYPKGLIVAFTLKSKSNGGSTEQNDTNDAANGVKTVSKEDGGLDSSENANKEIETMVTDDVSKGEKTPGENNEKDDKENVDENNGLGSVEKETEDVEESPEGPIEMGDEKEDKSAATVYKDDMNVVLREDLKDLFQKYGTVKFIDFKIGEDSGYVRFEDPEAAQKARAAAVLAEQGGLLVKNYIATLEPVAGEAEREYWSLLRGNQDRYRGNRGGRGGKFNRGGKHGRSREYDGRPNKAQKVRA